MKDKIATRIGELEKSIEAKRASMQEMKIEGDSIQSRLTLLNDGFNSLAREVEKEEAVKKELESLKG